MGEMDKIDQMSNGSPNQPQNCLAYKSFQFCCVNKAYFSIDKQKYVPGKMSTPPSFSPFQIVNMIEEKPGHGTGCYVR